MRKDYMPVTSDNSGLPDVVLVERHWTAIWQQNRVDPTVLAIGIAQREEYRLMSPYLNQLRPDDRICDAGCGLGEWTIFLSDQGYDVYGVDISRQTVSWLNHQFPQYNFLSADIRHLSFPDRFFDACFSWGVFEHFEEGLGGCINEAWRVLKPGAYLFISVPFHNWRHILRDARPLSRWGIGYDSQKGYSSPMRFYQWRLTIPELEQELAMRGFRVLKIRPISVREGLRRALHHDLHLKHGSFANRAVGRLLHRISPRRWFGHMLMAIAQKVNRPMELLGGD